MKVLPKFLVGFMMAAILAACSEQPAIDASTEALPQSPQAGVQPNYFPPIVPPPGQRTVEDVHRMYGAYATRKLNQYFAKAHVAFPPQAITLVALKQEKKLELWARDNNEFRLVHTYGIRAASGVAGPKLRQGDKQVPEGIYRIEGLNPNSHYHLSMKLNYPNEFDLLHATEEGRNNPGSDIFIHGRAVSIGCLAMGDEAIEELFILTSLVGKERAKVVIAPHDPRVRPLDTNSELLPYWTSELYSSISREISALSKPFTSARSMGVPSMLH